MQSPCFAHRGLFEPLHSRFLNRTIYVSLSVARPFEEHRKTSGDRPTKKYQTR